MYESIQGILIDKTPQKAVVETGGIGYRVAIAPNTYMRLPELSQQVRLFVTQVIREDSHTLYAFVHKEERDLFETLITLSGIGPKTALAILGHLEIEAFRRAIHAADIHVLSKIPGIGKKTAEKLVIEMRDKFKPEKTKIGASISLSDGILGDATNALIHLGYPLLQAQKAVQAALEENKKESDLGRIITTALQKI